MARHRRTLVDDNYLVSDVRVQRACPKETWVPDAARQRCIHCTRPFSLFRRRHHCRVCGDVLCGACSWTVYLVNTTSNVGRACFHCSRALRISATASRSGDDVGRPTCPNFVDALLVTSYDGAGAESMLACAKCNGPFADGTQWTQLPCGDAFHANCLRPWLAAHDACPRCHDALPPDMDYIRKLFAFA
ncbi:hypothetical protein SDRG_03925 [Saprolegnia diclina VS20]|uniref:FYVE-type domain-containing protein n=1 Tax=Saprolegnia diclina (strain VS20) TaxID=1156394 RepID=T0QWE5_SAPDV|nr:hypothetical protein SDRG_03925 [Saprolegnia diclina VS20]EQC38971.1 hypothetical protein SDRG_03925 [Saprolegnia diclina VS20]|eukprot:XP_008607795.1 hypothetical protein SDRG_03925 [Saprolegnia diclina VS20]